MKKEMKRETGFIERERREGEGNGNGGSGGGEWTWSRYLRCVLAGVYLFLLTYLL